MEPKDWGKVQKMMDDQKAEILAALAAGGSIKRVQRGAVAVKYGTSKYSVTIDAVDMEKAYVNVPPHPVYTSSGGATTTYGAVGRLVDSTTLQILAGTDNGYTVYYEVIEFN